MVLAKSDPRHRGCRSASAKIRAAKMDLAVGLAHRNTQDDYMMNETRLMVRWLPSVPMFMVAAALHLGCTTGTIPVGDDPIDDVDSSIVDTDGDGFSDNDEVATTPGTDPFDATDNPDNVRDTDGDGCSDFDELNFNGFCNNDPVVPGDGDGSSEPPPTPTVVPTPTAVGVDDGGAMSATIGATGGSMTTADGKIALTIPAGALASDTVISIQPITNHAHGGLGAGYRFSPDGQTFALPVALEFAYTDQDLAGSDSAILGAAFQTVAGYWTWLSTPTVDSVGKTVSISTTHFSDFSLVQGYRLQPLSKTLRVDESLALQVAFCYPATDSDLTPLGLSCDTDVPQSDVAAPFVISEWSVNGNAGGDATVGTVSGNGPSATYQAPATQPTPNTVAVSARVNLPARGETLVVSNITITDSATYTGTFNFSISLGVGSVVSSGSANVTWTQFEDLGDTRSYVPSGTITADITLAGCDTLHATVPIQATVPHGAGPTLVVYTASNSAFANSYQFGLSADPNTILTFRCGDTTIPSPAPIAIIVGVCTSGGLVPFTDEAQLTGDYSCLASGLDDATWGFTLD